MTILAPALARPRAIPRPKPPFPPVTIATLPCKSKRSIVLSPQPACWPAYPGVPPYMNQLLTFVHTLRKSTYITQPVPQRTGMIDLTSAYVRQGKHGHAHR